MRGQTHDALPGDAADAAVLALDRRHRIEHGRAGELVQQQMEPTIVTARWQNNWPTALVHRGVPVVRLANPGISAWGTLRYGLSLGRWLRNQAARFDLLYVSMLRHDAYTALSMRGYGGWPVVLRAEGVGEHGDCAWQAKANFGQRIARTCRTADAIVAPNSIVRDELLAAGYPADKVHLIPNGVAIPASPTSAGQQLAARAALAAANPELKLPEGARLAVYVGRLQAFKGLATFLKSWQALGKNYRDARLWLVGEGPLEGELEDQIQAAGLKGRVVLAGAFDAVDEVLQAADMFVLPSREEGLSLALLEALAAGLPVVASDIPGNRLVIEDGRQGLLFTPGDANALAAAMGNVLSDLDLAAGLAAAGRERVSREFSLGKMVAEHRTLFHRLTGTGNSCPSDASP